MENYKISDKNIESLEDSDIFGEWTTELDKKEQLFKNAKPFGHVVINNFLRDDIAEKIFNEFPDDFTSWHKYHNPLEVKFAYDNINGMKKNYSRYIFSFIVP